MKEKERRKKEEQFLIRGMCAKIKNEEHFQHGFIMHIVLDIPLCMKYFC